MSGISVSEGSAVMEELVNTAFVREVSCVTESRWRCITNEELLSFDGSEDEGESLAVSNGQLEEESGGYVEDSVRVSATIGRGVREGLLHVILTVGVCEGESGKRMGRGRCFEESRVTVM